jgi:hypothetical protein
LIVQDDPEDRRSNEWGGGPLCSLPALIVQWQH